MADTLYGTQLTPEEESQYSAWKLGLPPRLQEENDYDLRGFWKKNPGFALDKPGAHLTDEFKLPNHRTFSNESIYFNPQTQSQAGHWEQVPRSGGHWSWLPYDPAVKSRIEEDRNGDPVDISTPSNPEQAKTGLLMARLYGTMR